MVAIALEKIVCPDIHPTKYGKDPAAPKEKSNPLNVATVYLGGRLVEKSSG